MNMAKSKDKALTTFSVDKALLKDFKAACANKGITMTEVLVKAMKQTIKSK